jgi:flagellar biosynthesis GTPase FlhF
MQSTVKPQKFIGDTSEEVFRQVRAVHGDDAIVLSNKKVNGQTEIIVMSQDAIGALANGAEATSPGAPAARAPARGPRGLSHPPRARPRGGPRL